MHNTPEFYKDCYRKMLTIRYAEEMIAEDFRTNKIFSFYHSSAGQEAVAVGVAAAFPTLATSKARFYGNHRSHGHYIAKGGDLYRMFCEIYGKADGCCKGYGGSMHMLDRSVGFMGSTPILGSIVPIATGSAFEASFAGGRTTLPVTYTVVFLGDGASEEGAFYESLNLASLFRLPILYVVEDNLHAVNSPHSVRRGPDYDLCKIVQGLGVDYTKVDGNSFDSVYKAAEHIERFLYTGPYLMHAVTHRHMAHSGPIKDESVRVLDTENFRTENDCIAQFIKMLVVKDIIKPQEIQDMFKINDEVMAFVKQEFDRAKAAPEARP